MSFVEFEKLFKAEETKIHLLQREMVMLMQKLLMEFIKPEVMRDKGTTNNTWLENCVRLTRKTIPSSLKHISFPWKETTMALQNATNISHERISMFFMAVRESYVTIITEKLFGYLLQDDLTGSKMSGVLHPEAQTSSHDMKTVVSFATQLSTIHWHWTQNLKIGRASCRERV